MVVKYTFRKDGELISSSAISFEFINLVHYKSQLYKISFILFIYL